MQRTLRRGQPDWRTCSKPLHAFGNPTTNSFRVPDRSARLVAVGAPFAQTEAGTRSLRTGTALSLNRAGDTLVEEFLTVAKRAEKW